MKKIVKIITFYDDGTFSESVPSAPFSPMPTTPVYGPVKIQPHPDTIPRPFPDPYWNTNNCPKCGLKIDGPMGYVCNNNPCPCGLGGVYCSTGDCV